MKKCWKKSTKPKNRAGFQLKLQTAGQQKKKTQKTYEKSQKKRKTAPKKGKNRETANK